MAKSFDELPKEILHHLIENFSTYQILQFGLVKKTLAALLKALHDKEKALNDQKKAPNDKANALKYHASEQQLVKLVRGNDALNVLETANYLDIE